MECRYEEFREIMFKLKETWEKKEKYWFQRSRVKWTKFGDKNTRFFHQITRQRRQINKVVRIKDGNGIWLEEDEFNFKRFGD